MKRLKPLIAALVVIAVAMAGLALWSSQRKPPDRPDNSARVNAPDLPADGGAIQYDIAPLEDLPALDPLGLWPRDGYRLSAPEFWVMWETSKHCDCRLLASKGDGDWYVLGRTAGTSHFLRANLAYFDSKLSFAVEFEAGGKRYRSKPRGVSFGYGASFGQRRYKFRVTEDNQMWPLEIAGREASELGQEAFLSSGGLAQLTTFVLPNPAEPDTVRFGVQRVAELTGEGCTGFLEVFDARSNTYDRVLIELTR